MKPTRQEVLKQRDGIIPEFKALEKRFGAPAVLSAMRKHLTVTSQTKQREKHIRELTRRIAIHQNQGEAELTPTPKPDNL